MMDKFHFVNFNRQVYLLFAAILVLGMVFAPVQPANAFERSAGRSDPALYSDSAQAAIEPYPGRIYKAASKPAVTLGEVLTFTIHLEMNCCTSLKVEVIDPLPKGLEYVPGSASHEGVYDPNNRSITWIVEMIGTGTPVDLKFDAKDVAPVKEPTPVVNTATIAFNGFILQRQAGVTLMPDGSGSPDLSASFKAAKPSLLYAGEKVVYSIRLLNFGTQPATVQVVDPVPAALTFVPDSASHAGVYDPATRTITWKDVLVPPYSPLLPVEPVTLTFIAKAPHVFIDLYPIRPIVITNTAIISSDNVAFKRSVDILLLPYPHSPLEGSYKAASHRSVFPGQRFTYSVYLHNSSLVPVSAVVSDPLPLEVSYVPGSANANGEYDPTTRTLTWKDLTVLEGSTLVLTFDVIAGNLVITDTASITNTAYITAGGLTIKRSITVGLQPPPDPVPPVVRRFTIDKQDVLTGPEVVLHTDAWDDVGVRWMYLKEWVLATWPIPHWQPVDSSGWIPYQADYKWKLSEQSGTHYLAVWVADQAGNHSRLTRSAIDFASLLLPATHVGTGGLVPYLVYYPAGIEVTAELKTQSGKADLFVWYPGSIFYPDKVYPTPSSNIQKISFTTPTAGIYLFLVYGVHEAVFDLGITPGGGPRVPTLMPYGSTVADPGRLVDSGATLSAAELDGMFYNPILPQSGLDPLDVAGEPGVLYTQRVFLPAVVR